MEETGTRDAPSPAEFAASAAARAVARAAGREFASFRCGCALPEALRGATPAAQETFRKEVAARMREILAAAWPAARWDALVPDVVAEALPAGGVRVVFVPLYVAGRYRKLVRGLAQTVFLCRRCRGRSARVAACAACGGTGRLVAEAVEDFVVPPVVAAARGRRGAFHGSGREDVDVRMLGRGRPFVVSVEDAWRRTIDAAALADEVRAASSGRVEVEDLRVVRRSDMARLTTDHGVKTYRAVLVPAAEAPFPEDASTRVAALAGAAIRQRTPQRVADRRADAVRTRSVLGVVVEQAAPRRMVVVLRTEPGTYVKELVSGDDGRTEPSAAACIGVPASCAELDVLDVEDAAFTS